MNNKNKNSITRVSKWALFLFSVALFLSSIAQPQFMQRAKASPQIAYFWGSAFDVNQNTVSDNTEISAYVIIGGTPIACAQVFTGCNSIPDNLYGPSGPSCIGNMECSLDSGLNPVGNPIVFYIGGNINTGAKAVETAVFHDLEYNFNLPVPTPFNLHVPTNTPTSTASTTPSATATASNTTTASATATATNTFTATVTASETFTATASTTPSNTPTNTPSGTPTATSTPSFTPTNTTTHTPSNTPTNTATTTNTATSSETASPSNTVTASITRTPSQTPINTTIPSSTPSPTVSLTPSVTQTTTSTRTATVTPTMRTGTPTRTPSRTPSRTPTPRTISCGDFTSEDIDNDGLPDDFEDFYNQDLRGGDSDQDDLDDLQECELDTDPTNPDTDGGGVTDGEEYHNHTNPLNGNTGSVKGTVYFDSNKNNTLDSNEHGVPNITVHLYSIEQETKTDTEGNFSFSNVEPGSHIITLEESSLPKGYSLTVTKGQTVEVNEAVNIAIAIGIVPFVLPNTGSSVQMLLVLLFYVLFSITTIPWMFREK